MNIRERFLGALRGQPIDRVPLFLDGFLYKEVGYELKREDGYSWKHRPQRSVGDAFVFNNPADIENEPDPLKRKLCHRIVDLCPIVLTWPSYINRYFMTPPRFIEQVSREKDPETVETTTTIHTPKGDLTAVTSQSYYTVWTEKYPVESFEDIEKIRSIPWQPPVHLEPPQPSLLPEGYDERYVLTTRVSSPFVCVAGMMPYQYFLELCVTHIDLLKELSDECRDRTLAVLDLLLQEHNVDMVWMGGCEWITPPMASVKVYRELVQGYEHQLIDRIHQADALCQIHCHGNIRSTLELIIERGADFTEPVEPPPDGDVTFSEAKTIAGGRITLGGNIEANLLTHGSADSVEAAVNRAFEGGKHRMVLMPTAYPIDRFKEQMAGNYHRLIDIWEENSEIE